MRGWLAAGAALLMTTPAAAATLQEDYQAATTALAGGDAAGAVARFEALLARLPKAALANPRNATVALVRAGLGRARTSLGQTDAALAAFEAALPGLPAGTADERMNLADVLADVARNHERRADYPAARAALQRALALNAYLADDPATLRTQIMLIRVSIFDAPDVAMRASEASLPAAKALFEQAPPDKAKVGRDRLGEIYALRGRIHLNRGEPREALQWFERGLKAAGGIGRTVTIADTRVRGDLAIAHYLLGNEKQVRDYLGYTGAGRGDADIGTGADMPPPACGETTGLAPDDMAIVEFGIDDDGSVVGATPIYATRAAAAAPFVRAVGDWSWQPDAVAKLDRFWRASVRLELRCSSAGARPKLADTLQPAMQAWAKANRLALDVPDGSEAVLAPRLRAELAARRSRHGDDASELIPALAALGDLRVIPADERVALLQQASRIASEKGAPVEWRTAIGLSLVKALADQQSDRPRWQSARRKELAALLHRLEAAGEGGTRPAALVRVELAGTHDAGEAARAEALYRTVVAAPTTVVSGADPIRQAALLQLATIAAARREADEAARLVAATGLSAAQCALVDVRPAQIGGRVTTDDIPNEAMRWGFNGWVLVSYDIDTGGRPLAPRAVLAYPPFVYSASTADAIKRFRFQPLPRPSGNIGCTGRLQMVRYLMPK